MVAFDGAKVETLASPACTPMRGRCASASSRLLQSDGADHRCISGDGRVTLVEIREAKGRPARVEPSVERCCEAFCWRRPANLGEPKHLQRGCEAGRLEDHQRLLHNCFQSAFETVSRPCLKIDIKHISGFRKRHQGTRLDGTSSGGMWPHVDQNSEMRAVDMSLAIAPCSSQMPAKSPRSTTAILASAATLDAWAESAAFSRVARVLLVVFILGRGLCCR
jgi:hypothetical protein